MRLPNRSILVAALAFGLVAVAPRARAQHEHGGSGTAPSGVPMFRNFASFHHPVATTSAEAQTMFDQGLGLYYAFNDDEAIRSFKEAARLDPDMAMAWWGVAMALGPNINVPMSADAEKQALDALAKAQAAKGASASDRDYIYTLTLRYAVPAGEHRAARDSAYAAAMRVLMKKYPKDDDAAILCAESLMLLRPWDFYDAAGKAKPGVNAFVSILEGVLERSPRSIGAIHFYIHAVEASPHPERAEVYADELRKLAPEAGHLLHMPSHIYLRVGRYDDAIAVNERAVAADHKYLDAWKPETMYAMMYHPHNIHMRWSALCEVGRAADAADAARQLDDAVPWDMVRQAPPLEAFRAVDYYTPVRFGKWEEILAMPAPPDGMRIAAGFWHYARGMALAATGKFDGASAEQDSVTAIAAGLPSDAMFAVNAARPVMEYAGQMLQGEIAARSGKTDDAIALLTKAVATHDALLYDEPPPWCATARQALGAVLLQAGRAKEAADVYREDLRRTPNNGWSLFGLAQAEKAMKDAAAAAKAEAAFRKVWHASDVTLTASRF
ncbi:MAG: tetratricopeptide repeat protein [Hyphomicrobiales bacterium]